MMTLDLFKPIQGQKLSEQVADQILDLLHAGKLGGGTRLPSERELAQQLGVGRSSLREAVRILEARRILEVRQGLGTFLTDQAPDIEETALLPWLSANLDDVLQVLELREALEVKAASLAARNPMEEELGLLDNFVMQATSAVEMGDSALAASLDMQFHNRIAAMAGNKFLLPLSRSIRAINDHRAMLALPGRVLASIKEHRAIVEALRARDPVAAAQCMAIHMDSVIAAVSLFKMSGGE